jgi:hypothetical protein
VSRSGKGRASADDVSEHAVTYLQQKSSSEPSGVGLLQLSDESVDLGLSPAWHRYPYEPGWHTAVRLSSGVQVEPVHSKQQKSSFEPSGVGMLHERFDCSISGLSPAAHDQPTP